MAAPPKSVTTLNAVRWQRVALAPAAVASCGRSEGDPRTRKRRLRAVRGDREAVRSRARVIADSVGRLNAAWLGSSAAVSCRSHGADRGVDEIFEVGAVEVIDVHGGPSMVAPTLREADLVGVFAQQVLLFIDGQLERYCAIVFEVDDDLVFPSQPRRCPAGSAFGFYVDTVERLGGPLAGERACHCEQSGSDLRELASGIEFSERGFRRCCDEQACSRDARFREIRSEHLGSLTRSSSRHRRKRRVTSRVDEKGPRGSHLDASVKEQSEALGDAAHAGRLIS
jgi:hypothetical protein